MEDSLIRGEASLSGVLVPSLLLSILELSDAQVYEPQIRSRLGIAAHLCEVGVGTDMTGMPCALPGCNVRPLTHRSVFRVEGQGFGSRVWGLEFRVQGLGCEI